MNINLNGDSKYPINHKHFFKIMRTTLILLFCGIMFSQASNSYSQVFNFNLKSTFIKDVFNEIEENSDYIFVFTDKSEKIIDKKVDLNANSEDVKEILDNVLSTTGLTYRIIDKQIVDKTLSKISFTSSELAFKSTFLSIIFSLLSVKTKK